MMSRMIVLVRDEDIPTVAAAVRSIAEEEGLEPVDSELSPSNPFEALALLGGPHVRIADSGDQVLVLGLETLDLAEPEEWGEQLSSVCEAEVLVVDAADDGVRVLVFDDAELDETIEIMLDPSGKTRSEELAELTDSEDGARELRSGIAASNVGLLLTGILRCLGASPEAEGAVSLIFHDPLADEEDEEEQQPSLVVEPLSGAELAGKIGSLVTSPHGNVFGVRLMGGESVTGIRLELSGTALDLFTVEDIEVTLRLVDAPETTTLSFTPPEGELRLDLPNAFLEFAQSGPPGLDMNDLFSSMQSLMSMGQNELLNTITVRVSGKGRVAGEGELTLEATSISREVAGSAASIPIRVR